VGLYHALNESNYVLPIFIFDNDILKHLEDPFDRRVDFIHRAISAMHEPLKKLGSGLTVFHSSPLDAFKKILNLHHVEAVYANHDYEPYARERDETIQTFLKSNGIVFKTFKDQCVFEKNEVTKDDGKPYTVFTPYSNKWKKKLTAVDYERYPTEKFFKKFLEQAPDEIPSLKSLGFEKTNIDFKSNPAIDALLIQKYKEQRNYPATAGTSRLSVYLRFGVVSIRALVKEALAHSETWLNELIWRDFYMMILWQFPHVAKGAFKKQYDHIPWRNNEQLFLKWCKGETGFPIVDAGIRELNATGFMHNRVRMIVSSFLVKDLLISWQWGEAYFAQKLNDFDLSANNGGWQWSAGSGCDAAPYFRVFNPTEQQKKFDPEFKYIKKWIPEFETKDYPEPIVNHAEARVRTLQVYKLALSQHQQISLL